MTERCAACCSKLCMLGTCTDGPVCSKHPARVCGCKRRCQLQSASVSTPDHFLETPLQLCCTRGAGANADCRPPVPPLNSLLQDGHAGRQNYPSATFRYVLGPCAALPKARSVHRLAAGWQCRDHPIVGNRASHSCKAGGWQQSSLLTVKATARASEPQVGCSFVPVGGTG
jgi:hypothetical protein